MRAVLQRVKEACVRVDGRVTGEIGPGLLVLLGVAKGDTAEDAAYLARKVANLRVFSDEAGKMNRSVLEGRGAVLVISQFTLYGDCRKGRRPSFDRAAAPELAEKLYEMFAGELRKMGMKTATGIFRADMQVSLLNDGPVTLICETETHLAN